MRRVLTVFIASVVAMLVPVQTPTARAQGLPTTEQFNNLLRTCAAGERIEISGDLIGSISSIYDAQRTQGALSFSNSTEFLHLLPEGARLEAYNLYIHCITNILSQTPTLTTTIPIITGSILKSDNKTQATGPVMFESSAAELFNLDWKSTRYFVLSSPQCKGDGRPKYFQAAHVGDYLPYSRSTKKMLINEHNVWNSAPGWLAKLRTTKDLSCLEWFAIQIEYRLDFVDQRNVQFARFFSVRFQTRGEGNTFAELSESSASNWQNVGKLAEGKPTLSLQEQADAPVIRKAYGFE